VSTDLTFRSDFTVDLVNVAGSDEFICQAARVSTLGSSSIETEESEGLINFLMKNRHGSPFEHGLLTFRVEAPIFVWREYMRHRIASYNEQSGRYMEMLPVFYKPPAHRPLQQIGKPGHYEFVPGTFEQQLLLDYETEQAAQEDWARYQRLLNAGIAKEVSRIHLPLNMYSSAYVTMNPRGFMNFISLRTKDEDSLFPSYPQWEIERVALMEEEYFAEQFPHTHTAFESAGRVAP
jgi:thymidylate synthase (FAD)